MDFNTLQFGKSSSSAFQRFTDELLSPETRQDIQCALKVDRSSSQRTSWARFRLQRKFITCTCVRTNYCSYSFTTTGSEPVGRSLPWLLPVRYAWTRSVSFILVVHVLFPIRHVLMDCAVLASTVTFPAPFEILVISNGPMDEGGMRISLQYY